MARHGARASKTKADDIVNGVTRRWESIGEYCRWLDERAPDQHADRYRFSMAPRSTWAGGSYADARRDVLAGVPASVDRARALMERIMADVAPTARPTWERGPAGHFPCVPAFLAGDPACMFRRMQEPSTAAPLRVFASVAGSNDMSPHDLERRGMTILALAMILNETRPVELLAVAEMGRTVNGNRRSAAVPVIRLDTAPLDLTSASFVLSHPSMLRRLLFVFADEHGWDGQWAWGGSPSFPDNLARTKALIGCGPDDLYIPGTYDTSDMLDPVSWINQQLAAYSAA